MCIVVSGVRGNIFLPTYSCARNVMEMEFLQENLNMAHPKSTLPPLPERLNSRSKTNDPIGEVNVQVLSDSFCQREQMEAPRKDMTFSYDDSIVNDDSEASNLLYQHIPLGLDELREHFSKNQTVMNTTSPEIENTFDQTETSNSAAIECHRNEDAEASKLSSQEVILEQEQLLNHIGEHGPEINTSFEVMLHLLRQTQPSLALGNDAETRSNLQKYAAKTTSSRENPQNVMNFYDPQSICNREIHPSIEMITEIIESLQIKSQVSQLHFPVSSAPTSGVSQFVPENVIMHHNASGTQNQTCSFPGLFGSSAHSTENLSRQQDAHSSETETTMESVENFSLLRALLVERPPSPTQKSDFECEICKRKFTDEVFFAIHRQTHERPLPFKCNQCRMEFQYESWLRRHYVGHTEKWPFKCRYCDHASKRESDLNEHIRHRHKSQLSSRCPESDRKYKWKREKCSKRLESKFHFHVGNNCDPNPFKCDQCSREFPSEIQLKIHYVVHMGGRLFKCDMCPFAFFFEGNLERHKKRWH